MKNKNNSLKFSVADAGEVCKCLCWLALNGLLEYKKMLYHEIVDMVNKNTIEASVPDPDSFDICNALDKYNPNFIQNKSMEIHYFEEKRAIEAFLALMNYGYMPVDKNQKPSIKKAADWMMVVLDGNREATAVSWGAKILWVAHPQKINEVKIPAIIEMNTMASEENYRRLEHCNSFDSFMQKRNLIVDEALGNEIPANLNEIRNWFLDVLDEM